MHYTKRGAYRALCDEADAHYDVVKLIRAGTGWGLEIVAAPRGSDDAWRAAGVVFPELAELDQHADHLLGWLMTQQQSGKKS
jgi:hypothetical protein